LSERQGKLRAGDLFGGLSGYSLVCLCLQSARALPDKVRKADRPSALMRRTRVVPPEGRNKRERWLNGHSK
jgi:hypothetical protein